MDAAFVAARLGEELGLLREAGDREGAEELLLGHLSQVPLFAHYQLGQLYLEWNKLASSVAHYQHAFDLAQASGEVVLAQVIIEELRRARQLQSLQKP